MTDVIAIDSITAHQIDPDDEWEALCGEEDPPLLVDDLKEPLCKRFRPCSHCLRALTKAQQ